MSSRSPVRVRQSLGAKVMHSVRQPGLVSVVIATYNCRQYVCHAIASVLKQTYVWFELHVVDDGSTDGTAEAVAPFLEDRRVHYHYQPNAGHANAKNHGVRLCRGEFVAFCDADDMWLPDKLALQVSRFAGNDRLGVVYTRTALMNEHGALLPRDPSDEPVYPSGRVTADLFKINFVPFGTALVRRRCFDEVGLFDPRHGTSIDWEMWLRISLHYDFLFLDGETYVYRLWGGQMSQDWRRLYDHAFCIMQEFLAHHPDAIEAEAVRDAWAHSYTQRARRRSVISGEYAGALRDVTRALRIRPMSRVAWKTLSKIALDASGLRKTGLVTSAPGLKLKMVPLLSFVIPI
jgi:glycosyltransferase involved in cell wall biosynthesis